MKKRWDTTMPPAARSELCRELLAVLKCYTPADPNSPAYFEWLNLCDRIISQTQPPHSRSTWPRYWTDHSMDPPMEKTQ